MSDLQREAAELERDLRDGSAPERLDAGAARVATALARILAELDRVLVTTGGSGPVR